MLNLNKGIPFLPAYKLMVNGIDQTTLVRQRLIDISVHYSAGGESDGLDLSLDDSVLLKRLHVPLNHNDQIKLFIGYAGNLQDMGTFIVNGVSLSGGANAVDTFNVNAKAIDTAGHIFDLKTKHWQAEPQSAQMLLADILNKIAKKHSLECIIDPTLLGIMTKIEHQKNESDISFLRKLADRYGAAVKFYDGKLLFIAKNSKSITGIPIPPVIVPPHEIMNWSVTFGNRWMYKTFKAKWWDDQEADSKTETVINATATNDKEHVSKHVYNSADAAKRAAQADKFAMDVQWNNLTLSIIGNPAVRPFTPIVIAGVRQHVNGLWRTGNVTHTFSPSGYTTSMPEMGMVF